MHNRHLRVFGFVVIAGLVAPLAPSSVAAQQAARSHTLFHPVPANELRALSADRPGNGENPFTLDPGHVQVEIGAVGFTHIGARERNAFGFGAAATKLRVGVRRGTEVQFQFDGFSFSKSAGAWDGATGGFGARTKVNIWGDYEGATAFALIPALAFTRNGTGGWTRNGALSAALAAQLPSGWSLGVTVAGMKTALGTDDAVTGGLGAVSLGHAVRGPISAMAEATVITADVHSGKTEGRLGAALLASVTTQFQLDAGIDVGITRYSDAVRAYVGLVRRF
jgi:hypothetical protein